MRVPIAPHSHQHLELSAFQILTRLIDVLFFFLVRGTVVSQCCFNWHFPGDIWFGASLHTPVCSQDIFFDEVSVSGSGDLWPFLNWVVCVLIVEFYVFFVYFGGNESFVRCLLKIFFPRLAFDFA